MNDKTIRQNGITIYLSTRPYFTSHLRQPSGRGSWAFDVSIDGGETKTQIWERGAYAECRKAVIGRAVELAQKAGASSVSIDVLS